MAAYSPRSNSPSATVPFRQGSFTQKSGDPFVSHFTCANFCPTLLTHASNQKRTLAFFFEPVSGAGTRVVPNVCIFSVKTPGRDGVLCPRPNWRKCTASPPRGPEPEIVALLGYCPPPYQEIANHSSRQRCVVPRAQNFFYAVPRRPGPVIRHPQDASPPGFFLPQAADKNPSQQLGRTRRPNLIPQPGPSGETVVRFCPARPVLCRPTPKQSAMGPRPNGTSPSHAGAVQTLPGRPPPDAVPPRGPLRPNFPPPRCGLRNLASRPPETANGTAILLVDCDLPKRSRPELPRWAPHVPFHPAPSRRAPVALIISSESPAAKRTRPMPAQLAAFLFFHFGPVENKPARS